MGLLDEGLSAEERQRISKLIADQNAQQAALCHQDPLSEACLSDVGRVALHNLGDQSAELLPTINTPGQNTVRPVLFINGILTRRDAAEENGRLLSGHLHAPVDVVWNPTEGFFEDCLQTLCVNKQSIVDETTAKVVRYVRAQLRGMKATERLQVVAHSQGAAIASAAISYLSREERARLDLHTYGEATEVYPEGLHSLRRTINVLDLVPHLAGGLRAGRIALSEMDLTIFAGSIVPHAFALYLKDEQYRNDPERLRELERKEVRQMWHNEAKH